MKVKSDRRTRTLKITEPVTTLRDEGKFIHILTELPGIPEEKIKINLENRSTSITILASDEGVQYKKVITIPCEVRFNKKRFYDGVLELTLEKIP
jgi:HSP20 family molecular chaperone IbpA